MLNQKFTTILLVALLPVVCCLSLIRCLLLFVVVVVGFIVLYYSPGGFFSRAMVMRVGRISKRGAATQSSPLLAPLFISSFLSSFLLPCEEETHHLLKLNSFTTKLKKSLYFSNQILRTYEKFIFSQSLLLTCIALPCLPPTKHQGVLYSCNNIRVVQFYSLTH